VVSAPTEPQPTALFETDDERLAERICAVAAELRVIASRRRCMVLADELERVAAILERQPETPGGCDADPDGELVEYAEVVMRRHAAALATDVDGRVSSEVAANVAAGWLGVEIPDPLPQRSASRAGYRKTDRRRPSAQDDEARRLDERLLRP
jgi:hypothetical protein